MLRNTPQRDRKFKKVQAKKLVKSNKSISQIICLTKFHFFAISKMDKNEFLNWGKLPKMQFHEKKFDLFVFTSFFAWIFFHYFSGLCCAFDRSMHYFSIFRQTCEFYEYVNNFCVFHIFSVVKQRRQMCCSPFASSYSCASYVRKTEGFKAFYRSYTTGKMIF